MLRRIRDELGITIIWVEHIMGVLMRVVDRVMVLDHGEKIAEGLPSEVAADPRVIEVYLGTDAEATQIAAARRRRSRPLMLELEVGRCGLRQLPGAVRRRPRGPRPARRWRDRPQRRRQDDADAGDLGPDPADAAARSPCRASTCWPPPAHRIISLGIAHVPENRRLFPRLTVEDNLRMGAFMPAARRAPRRAARLRLRPVPPPEGAPPPARRHVVGRRAADVRDRPRADERTQAPAARRAVGRPGAGHRAAGVRAGEAHPRAAGSRC